MGMDDFESWPFGVVEPPINVCVSFLILRTVFVGTPVLSHNYCAGKPSELNALARSKWRPISQQVSEWGLYSIYKLSQLFLKAVNDTKKANTAKNACFCAILS